ncbi:MAG: efflux RND transporter periplasmic adaptor subunit [Pirellulales bacterium]
MLACSLLALVLCQAGDRPALAIVPNCLVTVIDEIDVPAREAGQLTLVEIVEGMPVEAGQLLAQIDDEQPRRQRDVATLEHNAAQAKADNDVAVRHAESLAEVAKVEYDDAVAVNKRGPGTLSQSEVRKRRLQWETAELQIEQARFEQQVHGIASQGKAAEVAAADTSISRRRVLAPLSGVVVELPKRAGEWVQPGDRVARIVRLDRLRVEGFVRAAEFHPDELDERPVTVEVSLARGQVEKFSGKVVFVHPKVEADGEFRIWAEVVNRRQGRQWLLRPGTKAEMRIDLMSPAETVEESEPTGS